LKTEPNRESERLRPMAKARPSPNLSEIEVGAHRVRQRETEGDRVSERETEGDRKRGAQPEPAHDRGGREGSERLVEPLLNERLHRDAE
jgi:hypothetical protein